MTRKQKVWSFIGGGVLVFVIFFFMLIFVKIPTGYTGIVTTFGDVEEYTLEAGAHLKSPVQRIVRMDNREQRMDFELLAFSSDIQEVRVIGSINYNIDKQTAMKLYKEVGVDYAQVLIIPRLAEQVKGTFTQFTAAGLVQNRATLSDTIKSAMEDEIEAYGINVISIAIHDVDFSDAYTNAVEAKQVAEQTKLRAAIEQDQLTNEATQNARREIIKAETELTKANKAADAAAYAITTKANAEAEANLKLSQSLTPELTAYLEVLRWDGVKVPQFNGVTPLISMPVK